MTDVGDHFAHASSDNPIAADKLLPLVYDELRRIAASRMNHENPGLSLDATGLVHEVFLRLGDRSFRSRGHFLRVAAECMRRLLIDHARKRKTEKRGGQRRRIPLDAIECWADSPGDLLALEDSLQRLARDEPSKAELVVLRFFAGMTMSEAAQVLEVSLPTAERWWTFARTWLYADLSEENSPAD